MIDETDYLTEAFRRQLQAMITPAVVRAVEQGEPAGPLWARLQESGFLDAMLSEEAGGAGLGLAQAFPIIFAAGEFGMPLPFSETMIARGMLAAQNVQVPGAAGIVFAPASTLVVGAKNAEFAFMDRKGEPTLVRIQADGDDLFNTGAATMLIEGEVIASLNRQPDCVLLTAGAIAAASMAGAMARLLEMSLRHVSERQQFGRPLGKFQAIQQQLAVLAEQVLSAQVAARNAFVGAAFDPLRVAAAKCRANEAAGVVCNIAHAIHGAIGVTAEFDLQLYTRRLKQWQLAYGSEAYWGARLGKARIAEKVDTSADFLRLHLATQEP
jgi:acyl-CoA dehydrogenase